MKWLYKTPGIPEDDFVRGDVPITKTEVRVITLSQLQLKADSQILEIGCGTGSVTVEMANICLKGQIFAIDQNEKAIQLTQKNLEKFQLDNVQLSQGKAPEDLPDKKFDRIFVGGGSKKVEDIIAYAKNHLVAEGKIVLNTILLKSSYEFLQTLELAGFVNISCVCVNIARGENIAGWMMKAMNPIYVISAQKGEDC